MGSRLLYWVGSMPGRCAACVHRKRGGRVGFFCQGLRLERARKKMQARVDIADCKYCRLFGKDTLMGFGTW